jgi:hypothetical protein
VNFLPQLSQAKGPESGPRFNTISSNAKATKLTFFGVDAHVLLQIALRREKFVAIRGHTVEGVAKTVQAQMGTQPVARVERLGAIVFAAVKRLLLCVDAHMNFQRVAGQELLGAPFFGTRELVFA